ncbi:MAG: hypothetical protein R3E85_07225 [Planctomycetota bacterium]
MCDLTIAARERVFGQTGPKGRLVRRLRLEPSRAWSAEEAEIWFLCRQYDARQALEMGMVNTVVRSSRLEGRDRAVVPCGILAALAARDPLPEVRPQRRLRQPGRPAGRLAGNATLLYYMTEEGQEGAATPTSAKRKRGFDRFPKRP